MGEVVEDLATYYRLRQDATSKLIGALESDDQSMVSAAQDQWTAGNSLAAKIRQDRQKALEDILVIGAWRATRPFLV